MNNNIEFLAVLFICAIFGFAGGYIYATIQKKLTKPDDGVCEITASVKEQDRVAVIKLKDPVTGATSVFSKESNVHKNG